MCSSGIPRTVRRREYILIGGKVFLLNLSIYAEYIYTYFVYTGVKLSFKLPIIEATRMINSAVSRPSFLRILFPSNPLHAAQSE